MAERAPEQASARTGPPRGRRPAPQPVRTHAYLPDGDGQCVTCPLPRSNRAHEVVSLADEVSARLLGEREGPDQ